MATQSLEFGYTTGQTLTAQLFAVGSDTVVATADSVTEAANREGRYVAAFEDVPAGEYLLVYFLGGIGSGSERYVLSLTTATFQPIAENPLGTNAPANWLNAAAIADDAVGKIQDGLATDEALTEAGEAIITALTPEESTETEAR